MAPVLSSLRGCAAVVPNKTTCHWPYRQAPPSASKTGDEWTIELFINCTQALGEAASNQNLLREHDAEPKPASYM